MDIENYPDLKDLVLGQGAEERPMAPEPTLLPLLAPFSGPETLEYICNSAEIYVNGPLPPWPDLRSAVYCALGPQLQNHKDIVPLLGQFPGLASWLPDSYFHQYPALLKAVETLQDPAEVLARLWARFSRHRGGFLASAYRRRRQVLAAREVIGELADWQRGGLLGWVGAAATRRMQKPVLREMLSLGALDVESVGAFIRQLGNEEGELLAMHFAETLDAQSSYGAIKLTHLLPSVGSDSRAGLRDRIRSGFEEIRGYYPPGWYLSLLVSRLVEAGETDLAVEFTETHNDIDGFWLTHLREMPGRAPGRQELGDVLLAHPGAELLHSRGIGLESLNSVEMVGILDRMIDQWGGSAAPVAESAFLEESEIALAPPDDSFDFKVGAAAPMTPAPASAPDSAPAPEAYEDAAASE